MLGARIWRAHCHGHRDVFHILNVRADRIDFRRQLLEGYSLTTAKILYRLPDHPSLLQTYVWQEYDLFPKFPALNRFLAFWLENLEGPLHSVIVAHSRLIKPAEIRAVNSEFRLH